MNQPQSAAAPLALSAARCCICDVEDAEPVGVGEDFEYRTTPETFLAMRCRGCGLVYLNPRPAESELPRLYPSTYHAFAFSPRQFGLVYRVRRWLEGRRLLGWCKGLPEEARILDVGCGDGFHLGVLRDFGKPGWKLEGIDLDERAVRRAAEVGLAVSQGSIQSAALPPASYDLVLLIMTIEHVADPLGLFMAIKRLLRPGGRLVVVTDNTGGLDNWLFRGRHWGGYHFPRHWNLFDRATLTALASKAGLEVLRVRTMVSPVNWVYSVRNLLVDWGAPSWLVNRFSLKSPGSLAFFTVVDNVLRLFGRGSILQGIFRRPDTPGERGPE